MSTPSAPAGLDSFPPGEPWRLPGIPERGCLAHLTDAARVPSPTALLSLTTRGFNPRPRDPIADDAIKKATFLISKIPSLDSVVRAQVRGLAIIASDDGEYDTSHSEPAWPGWAFVSVPPASPVGSARLAESIVHEAMHLNLSAFEEVSPLVMPAAPLYSPWKQEMRTAQGVLHGLYVFGSLHAFFRALGDTRLPIDVERHLDRRMKDIEEEVAIINRSALEAALTPSGICICRDLYSLFGHGKS